MRQCLPLRANIPHGHGNRQVTEVTTRREPGRQQVDTESTVACGPDPLMAQHGPGGHGVGRTSSPPALAGINAQRGGADPVVSDRKATGLMARCADRGAADAQRLPHSVQMLTLAGRSPPLCRSSMSCPPCAEVVRDPPSWRGCAHRGRPSMPPHSRGSWNRAGVRSTPTPPSRTSLAAIPTVASPNHVPPSFSEPILTVDAQGATASRRCSRSP